MLARAVPLFRIITIVLVLALVVMGLLIFREVLFASSDAAPTTEVERATQAAQEAVKANPQDPIARIKLAAAYLEQKNTAGSVEQAQTAIRLAPDDPAGHYILGLAFSAKGDAEAAVVELKKAAETEGQQAGFYQDAYVALARAQEKTGDLQAAIKSMNKAIDYGPENTLLLYERGQMFERNEKFVDALLDYSRALAYVPDWEEAMTAFSRVASAHPDALEKAKEFEDVQNVSLETTATSPHGAETTATGANAGTTTTTAQGN